MEIKATAYCVVVQDLGKKILATYSKAYQIHIKNCKKPLPARGFRLLQYFLFYWQHILYKHLYYKIK